MCWLCRKYFLLIIMIPPNKASSNQNTDSKKIVKYFFSEYFLLFDIVYKQHKFQIKSHTLKCTLLYIYQQRYYSSFGFSLVSFCSFNCLSVGILFFRLLFAKSPTVLPAIEPGIPPMKPPHTGNVSAPQACHNLEPL